MALTTVQYRQQRDGQGAAPVPLPAVGGEPARSVAAASIQEVTWRQFKRCRDLPHRYKFEPPAQRPAPRVTVPEPYYYPFFRDQIIHRAVNIQRHCARSAGCLAVGLAIRVCIAVVSTVAPGSSGGCSRHRHHYGVEHQLRQGLSPRDVTLAPGCCYRRRPGIFPFHRMPLTSAWTG